MPASHPSAVLSDEEFRTGISLRLFLDQGPQTYVCPFSSTPAAAKCGSQLDSQGLHLIACPVGGGLVGGHDSIRDVLRGLLVDQGFNTHVEQSLFAPTGELIGRSDLFWVNDRCMAVHIDVAIVPGIGGGTQEGKRQQRRCRGRNDGEHKVNQILEFTSRHHALHSGSWGSFWTKGFESCEIFFQRIGGGVTSLPVHHCSACAGQWPGLGQGEILLASSLT